MPCPTVRPSPEEARRFHRRAVGLHTPNQSMGDVFARLGFVQIDPLNVCGRMHDLILRNRVAAYPEGGLMRFLHGGSGAGTDTYAGLRGGFEHFLPESGVLVGFPFEAWPFIQPRLAERRRRAQGYYSRLTAAEERLAERILGELRARGPLSSDDIEHEERSTTAWGSRARRVKTVLEKLFAHGRVLISGRRGFRRIYDLPERVLPPEVRSAAGADAQVPRRWSALLKLRQRRLALLRRDELARIEDLVAEVCVDGSLRLHCLAEDLPLLELPPAPLTTSTLLLAPLDPLIYDRRVTSRLWEFNYTWEVYTPAAKRVRGYYALPVLRDHALVGHVEPRFDRVHARLTVRSRRVRRGGPTAPALRELERFLRSSAEG